MVKVFKFLVFSSFYFSFIFSKAPSLLEFGYIPGSYALSDLVKESLGREDVTSKQPITLTSGKAKDNKELYGFWELKFYNQEKEILQRLFKSWSVTKDDLFSAICDWHFNQKFIEKNGNKNDKNLKRIDLKSYPVEFAIITDVVTDMGFKVEDIDFYLRNDLRCIFEGARIENLIELTICKMSKETSKKIFKYVIFHEFVHILYKDLETLSFLCSLASVKGKSLKDLNGQDPIVNELRKNQEMRAYILAAIKYSFLYTHLYLNREELQGECYPKNEEVQKELAYVESMSPDFGLVKKGLLAVATFLDFNI
ncbi:TPA: hypothetical protein DEO28_01235 [Candidatus Dependentiae bacterium]|nr:MAG: hypothetical protein UR14_C0003G0097 [candidate division TM6 bacterium GW2011_GWE2_31_21]KKP53739.1 MAG: hypothetical protein UR43_C0003G0060 [candidate division TM6 bacterium GW2011_GWF2_33_332]HBS48507.1 hypothetical protein [Candidatus Dependentiae bacterium]HBZ73122.1 hypothetical protein [Candidatus Dependentiae bacterium]